MDSFKAKYPARQRFAARGVFSSERYRAIIAIAVVWLLNACDSSQPETEHSTAPEFNVSIRAGEPVHGLSLVHDDFQPIVESPGTVISISPALPDGLTFDAVSARISGSATSAGTSEHLIQLIGSALHTSYTVNIQIDKSLPAAFRFLAPGFNAETIISGAEVPVRMALAKDGRLFYAELQTGRIRIVHPFTGLVSQPFAQLDVSSGEERGLLGLALDPHFDENGYVYAHATFADSDDQDNNVARIVRLAAVGDIAVDTTILVNHLPAADIHNGGDLVFDQSGHLFVGRGDIKSAALAQTDDSTAGRILRYTKNGGIPADNPYPGNPEWARGLRNSFALTVHPASGDLFGADAGPASNDKLQYLKAGKNFLWGMEEEPSGSDIGFSVRVWNEVITPTSLHFHSGTGGFSSYKNQLFLSSYNDEDIRVIHLTGNAYTDFIREERFAIFRQNGFANKPLHMVEGPDGSLYISTFNSIYRINRAS